MVRADACFSITLSLVTPQAGRVAIYRQAAFMGGGDLCHQVRITSEHARKVHHLGKVANAIPIKKCAHIVRAKGRARRFKLCGRDAARCAE